MDAIETALANADLFVSIGTSGAVFPAAGFVQLARAVGADTLELNLEPSFIAPRNTLEAIAANQARAASLLVPWQQELLGIRA